MLTSEPLALTLGRRQSASGDFPELNYSTPDQIADVDAAFPDRLPSTFTQQAVRLGNATYAAYPSDEPDAVPNVLPWQPSPGPLSQPTYGQSYDEGAQPATGGYSGGAGDNGRTPLQNIGSFAGQLVGWGNLPASLQPDSGAPFAQQQEDVNRLGVEAAMQAGVPTGLETPAPDLGAAARQTFSWMEAADRALAESSGANTAAAIAQVPEAYQFGRGPSQDLINQYNSFQQFFPEAAGYTHAEDLMNARAVDDYLSQRGVDIQGMLEQDKRQLAGDLFQFERSGGGNPPIAGTGGAEQAPEDFFAQMQAKKAAGEALTEDEQSQLLNMLGEQIGAIKPREVPQAKADFYNAPENLGGGETLLPEAQANLDALAPHAQQLNTITNSLENARAAEVAPESSALEQVINRNADELPEPTRTQPPAGYLERFRQPPTAGGADEGPAEPFLHMPGEEPARSFPESVPPITSRAKEGALSYMRNLVRAPLDTINNTARSTTTFLDVAGPGRLAPTTGLYAPRTYAQAWAKVAETIKDPETIQHVWDSIDNDPEIAKRGISVTNMFTPVDKGGYGLAGSAIDPYTGEATTGTSLGLLGKLPGAAGKAVNDRLQFLNAFNQVIRPQLLREEIVNRGLTAEDLANPAVREDLGRAVNLVTGHASFRLGGDEANLIFMFPNWLSAQAELLARGVSSGGITGNVARTTLGRLAALGTAATVAANYAQGVPITDKRAWRNGIPQIVLTKPLTDALRNTPGIGKVADFKPDTQFDAYGPIGELLQHLGGIGRAAYEGATGGSRFGGPVPTTMSERLAGAAQGALGETAYYGRTQLSEVGRILADIATGKTIGGEPTSLQSEAESFAPFNAQSIIDPGNRATGTEVGGMLGGRFHEPSASAQAASGGFSGLNPDDQFKAIGQQAWQQLPGDVRGSFDNFYAWRDNQERQLAKAYEERGLSQLDAEQRARTTIQSNGVVKAFDAQRNHLEQQWVVDHPKEAATKAKAELAKPWQERTWTPSAAELKILKAAGALK